MATTIITTPLGTFSSPKFTLSLPRMTWDPLFAKNVDLIGGNLTVVSGVGPDQGVCIYPEFAQESGTHYYEITWAGLQSGAGLAGGIALGGIGSDYFSLIGGVGNEGGMILRADGTIWTDAGQWNLQFPAQQEGDTVGVLVDIESGSWISISFFGVGGSIKGFTANGALISVNADPSMPIPPFPIIPYAIFGNDALADAQTANFSRDRDAYLGPIVFPNSPIWNNISFGWPNTA